MEFCMYKWMLNGKYTDVPVMNRWASCMVVAVQRKHPWKQLSSVFEIHAMENYLGGLLSELETDMFKNQAQQLVEKFHLLLSPFMTWFWLAHRFLCCITHRLSSSVHGDYLLPSEGPVFFALYSLLLERNSLLLVMRLSNLLAPVAMCSQEPTCIEL